MIGIVYLSWKEVAEVGNSEKMELRSVQTETNVKNLSCRGEQSCCMDKQRELSATFKNDLVH